MASPEMVALIIVWFLFGLTGVVFVLLLGVLLRALAHRKSGLRAKFHASDVQQFRDEARARARDQARANCLGIRNHVLKYRLIHEYATISPKCPASERRFSAAGAISIVLLHRFYESPASVEKRKSMSMIPKTHEAVLTMPGRELWMLWLFVQAGHEAWMVQHHEILKHPKDCVRHTRIRPVGDVWAQSPSYEFIIRHHPSCEEEWAVSIDYAEKEGRIVIAASQEESLKKVVEGVRRFLDNRREGFYTTLQIEIRPVAA